MKRTLQWTSFVVACGLFAAAFVTARPAQGDANVAADGTMSFAPVNVRVEDLLPHGR
ncbi:MAG TPA: hypothetical protein VMN56_09465 [Casimicrobiaceae bacterium]|nr:hypothetical protein [Casimicrobiaceae bacterium]